MTTVDAEKVEAALREAVEYLLRGKKPARWTDDTILTKDLGLDSEDGVELACFLSESLGIEIPDKVNPLIGSEQGQCHHRTLGEVATLILELSKESAGGPLP
jgi:acyl carrier protein